MKVFTAIVILLSTAKVSGPQNLRKSACKNLIDSAVFPMKSAVFCTTLFGKTPSDCNFVRYNY
nr:MAG TPA: hypothetical protein [Caudoviricetes sp.]